MTPHALPEYHAALLEPSAYPERPRKVRFEETARSRLYRTSGHVYKVRKASSIYSSAAIRERYAQLALSLGRRWGGDVVQAVVPVVRNDQGYALGGPGEPVDYALRMAQLPEAGFLHRLLAQAQVTPGLLERLAAFLAERHAAASLSENAAPSGRPEHVQSLLDEVTYQTRKYVGQTVNEALLDMIARPLGKFMEESRRTLLRRQKRGYIVDGHGAFIPEHLFVSDTDIHALSPLEAQTKFRVLDAASDVALLFNALALHGGGAEHAEQFVKRYVAASKDRDLPRVLPVYRVLQAMRAGLLRSERRTELPPEARERQTLAQEAAQYYTVALDAARQMPRSA